MGQVCPGPASGFLPSILPPPWTKTWGHRRWSSLSGVYENRRTEKDECLHSSMDKPLKPTPYLETSESGKEGGGESREDGPFLISPRGYAVPGSTRPWGHLPPFTYIKTQSHSPPSENDMGRFGVKVGHKITVVSTITLEDTESRIDRLVSPSICPHGK